MRRFALALLLLALATPLSLAQLPAPEMTTDGSFEGTWYRVQRGERQALQIRKAENGTYEVNFYWWTELGFQIDTNFAEEYEFAYQAFPGSLKLSPNDEASGENEIILNFERSQAGNRGSLMLETGDVRLYRSGDGRKLAWIQDPLHVKVTVEEAVTPREKAGVARDEERTWIFRRVARRMVPWNEIEW